MKKNRLHTITIIMGSLLALAIAFSQFMPLQSDCVSENVKTEQTEGQDSKGPASHISLPAFSLPAPFHVQADPDAYCLFEILFEEEDRAPDVEQDLYFTDRIFETIFSVIISPNAP